MEPIDEPAERAGVQRIVVTGAECTGKTTLARALAESLGAPRSEEYVRRYVERIRREPAAEDNDPIARGQLEEEDRYLPNANRFIVHDTNLLSTRIYADHYFGLTLDWLERAFARRRYALYLLCEPDFPWVPDPGQRESADVRDALQQEFERRLREENRTRVRVAGDPKTRLQRALEAIRAQTA